MSSLEKYRIKRIKGETKRRWKTGAGINLGRTAVQNKKQGGIHMYSGKNVAELIAVADHNPDAQYLLHMIYGMGRGVPVDVIKSLEWCIRAAEQGHLGAQYFMYLYYSLKCHIPSKDNTKFIKQCICIAWSDYTGIEMLHNDYPQLYGRMIYRDINVDELLEMPEIQAVRKNLKDLLSG